ncbi:hypothetical protein [Caudoviricetes sp.]|nr:hypothetical protein [Caudoviricetes sp.]
MAYSRRGIENPSDRRQLEESEARMLFRTWQATKNKVLTADRMEFLEKRYGRGSVERIRQMMVDMKEGRLI